MKKIWKITACVLCCCALFTGASCGIKPKENSDGKVAIDTSLMNEYSHENIFEITPTKDGLKMEGIQNLRAACSKMRFSIEEGEKLSVTFSLPVYEEDSEDFITTGINMHTKTCVDVMLRGQTVDAPTAQLRLWGEKNPEVGCVPSRITYRMNGESATYDSSFSADAGEYPYADGAKVTGNMRASKSFTIVFDKENLFQSYVGGDGTEIVPLLDETKEEDKRVIDGMKNAFSGVRSVSLIFRFSGLLQKDLEDRGMTGFEASSCFVLKEINGQSLCSEDGRIKDDGLPYIASPEIAEGQKLVAYRDYVYEVKTNESADVGRETVLYSAFATDVLSWKNLDYYLIITSPDGTVTKTDGLKYSVKEGGTYKVKAVVRDESGNEYVSKEASFTAVDSYRINVLGDIPEKAKKGSAVIIPSAYVTNAEGSRKDSEGNEYQYTLTIKNPLDMDVTVGADGKITLDRNGVYIIVYKSVSADGEDVREYRIVVS